jgi:hypothetical protein
MPATFTRVEVGVVASLDAIDDRKHLAHCAVEGPEHGDAVEPLRRFERRGVDGQVERNAVLAAFQEEPAEGRVSARDLERPSVAGRSCDECISEQVDRAGAGPWTSADERVKVVSRALDHTTDDEGGATCQRGWRSSARSPAKAKGGAGYGYTKVLGYHPIIATRADTGEVLHARMRKGQANTQRGVRRFIDELVARIRRAGATGELMVRFNVEQG